MLKSFLLHAAIVGFIPAQIIGIAVGILVGLIPGIMTFGAIYLTFFFISYLIHLCISDVIMDIESMLSSVSVEAVSSEMIAEAERREKERRKEAGLEPEEEYM